MYEHSGIALSTEPFNDRLDSGQLGIIYCTKEKAKKEIFCPDEKELIKTVEDILKSELKTYNQYIEGEVYGYMIEKDGEDMDSCWGYYGEDVCLEEAKRTVDFYWEKEAEKFIPGLEPVEVRK